MRRPTTWRRVARRRLTATQAGAYLPNYLPLPHPSCGNIGWLKRIPGSRANCSDGCASRVGMLL